MGSDSDLDVAQAAIDILAQFNVPFEARVLSAHRTPGPLREYLEKCDAQVFIAAAGGAAHLAGVIAAETTKPVIALPVQGKSLNGLDSLLSMVQMPPGIPVACVGVGAGRNAGLLAVSILSVSDKGLADALGEFRKDQAAGVVTKDANLQVKFK